MNGKAKLAYSCIVVGFIMFLASLIFLINHKFSLTKQESKGQKTNASAQLNLYLTVDKHHQRNTVELSWYCLQKQSISSDSEVYRVDLEQARVWLSLFSFIICSRDQLSFGAIVALCMFSFFLCVWGCVRFYKHDIKLLENVNQIDNFTVNI